MVCSGVSSCFVNQFSYNDRRGLISAAPSGPGRVQAHFPNSGRKSSLTTISYPESLGSLVSGWSPEETLRNSKI